MTNSTLFEDQIIYHQNKVKFHQDYIFDIKSKYAVDKYMDDIDFCGYYTIITDDLIFESDLLNKLKLKYQVTEKYIAVHILKYKKGPNKYHMNKYITANIDEINLLIGHYNTENKKNIEKLESDDDINIDIIEGIENIEDITQCLNYMLLHHTYNKHIIIDDHMCWNYDTLSYSTLYKINIPVYKINAPCTECKNFTDNCSEHDMSVLEIISHLRDDKYCYFNK